MSEAPAYGGGSETLLYDGLGQRVEKTIAGGATTVYVYDAFGKLAAEYATSPVQAPCTTCYLVWDQLGSTRLVADQNGNVVARHDYLPFGEEIATGTAGRNWQWGLFDSVNQKFTGQVRDSETGQDFFHARYFTGTLGRFNSPDPANAGADLANPQSWNGYGYVGNNPLALVDPSGMNWLSSIGDWVAGFFGDDCGATFCDTVVAQAPVGTWAWSTAGGSLTLAGGGGGYSGGGGIGGGGGSSKSQPPAKQPQPQPPPKTGFTKQFLPPNANICFDNQNYFYAPPTFDIQRIEAAGKAGGSNLLKANDAVGHYGTFDFQRTRDGAGNTTFYSGYTPVSNFSVGAYLQAAGFSKSVASLISNTFAFFKSSNTGDPRQATYRNLGYDTAARGQVPVCQAR